MQFEDVTPTPVGRARTDRTVGDFSRRLACCNRNVVGGHCSISNLSLLPRRGSRRDRGTLRLCGDRGHQALSASVFARAACQMRLFRTVTPTRRSLSCVKIGPLPALRSRRPVACERLLILHHSAKDITRSSSTTAPLCRFGDKLMATPWACRSRQHGLSEIP